MFDLGPRYSQESDAALAKKAKAAQKSSPVLKMNANALIQKIAIIKSLMKQYFGDDLDKYRIVRSEEELSDYISKCIEFGKVGFDTETTGLDPIIDQIAGFSMFFPGEKAIYCPINHISYITGQRVKDQLEPQFIKEQFERLTNAKTKLIMHNAKFDIRVVKNQIGADLSCYWDTLVGAFLLNENEQHGLKVLWEKYCNAYGTYKGKVDYDSLFAGLPFTYIPISVGYPYAARDPEITYDVYEFQSRFLDPNHPQFDEKYLDLANLFHNLDMPIVKVLSEIEDVGVTINADFASKLSVEYNEKLTEAEKEFHVICESFEDKINSYRFNNRNCKLSNPINLSSPTQIAILLYDILGIKSPSRKDPRGTGVDNLEAINLPITKALLKHRGIAKLLSTYIDKLPLEVKSQTGKLHGGFSQTTAVTGRLASSGPNLQNIPSRKGKEIRKMFMPSHEALLPVNDDLITFTVNDQVETKNGWKYIQDVNQSDCIISDTNEWLRVDNIVVDDTLFKVKVGKE